MEFSGIAETVETATYLPNVLYARIKTGDFSMRRKSSDLAKYD